MTRSNFKAPSDVEAPPLYVWPKRRDSIGLCVAYLKIRMFLYVSRAMNLAYAIPFLFVPFFALSLLVRMPTSTMFAGVVSMLIALPIIDALGWPMLVRQIESMHGSVDDYNRPYLERLSSLQRQIEDPVFAAEVREAKAAVTAPEAVGVRFRRLRASAFFVAMFAVIAVLVVVVEKFVHGLSTFPLMILLLAGAQWFIVPKVTKRMHRRRHPDDDTPAPRAHPHPHEGDDRPSD
jgi:hypothetical protein